MNYKINSKNTECLPSQVKGFSGKDFLQLSNGAVKLVKIEPMSSYPEHIHPDKTEYAFVLEGSLEIVIDGLLLVGEVGDFFIFPSQIKHAIINNTSHEASLLIGSIKN